MPRHSTFNQSWLSRTDTNRIELSKWLQRAKTTKAFRCLLCKTNDLDCSNRRWGAIEQHMKTNAHMENIKSLKNNSTFLIEPSVKSTGSTGDVISIPCLQPSILKQPLVLDFKEQVSKAEVV